MANAEAIMKLEQKASLPALLIVLTIYIGSRAISYGQDNIEKGLNAAGTLILRVVIIFDPPSNQQGPPQNIRLDSTCMNMTRTANAGVHPMISSGYNIYCIPSLPLGQPFPTPEEIVGNPNNLVGSIPSSSTVFEDQIAVSNCEENFCYSLTSFYENGAQSGGSTIVCTPSDSEGSPDSPMIKNPVFTKGTIFIDAGGSFIASQGALLIINDADS